MTTPNGVPASGAAPAYVPAPSTLPVVLTAVAVALIGAVGASLLILVATLAGIATFPRSLMLQSPVVFPFSGRISPLMILAFLIGLVVLAAVVALTTRVGARAASPVRGSAAVVMAVWLGTILGGAFAALLGAPLRLISYRMPSELLLQQVYSSFGAGAYWGIVFGWVVGLAAAVAFTSARRRGSRPPQPGAPGSNPTAPR